MNSPQSLKSDRMLKKAIVHFGLANQHDDSRYDWHFRYARLLDRHARTLEDYDKSAAMAVEEYTRTIALKSDYAPGNTFIVD